MSSVARHLVTGGRATADVGTRNAVGAHGALHHSRTGRARVPELVHGGALARGLTLPGFLLTVLTGIGMVVLRYGLRAPLWVWIKVALTTAALAIATPIVGPALDAARQWAHWSLEHGYLAAELQYSVARANLYGGIVFALFVLNIPVAIWKPFSGLALSQLVRRRAHAFDGGPQTDSVSEGAVVEPSSPRSARRRNF